jgi:hypothetical protein
MHSKLHTHRRENLKSHISNSDSGAGVLLRLSTLSYENYKTHMERHTTVVEAGTGDSPNP